tara:strand:+ start:147461 stop:148489 length:1029 start_codon:yes stop_codon:yes gene_type:complete
MGGRALKNTYTRRYQKDEFNKVKDEIFDIMSSTFIKYSIPRYFASKESFGDIDIIVSLEGFEGDMRTYIESTFNPNEIFHNGNAYSFDYKEIQVDFITCEPEYYISNYHYLAFNDLGNLTGRLSHKIGLKYGQEGLWYNHYYNGQNVAKIIISTDYSAIFDFLDLDYTKWIEGFDTLDEIFKFVTTSKYFNPVDYRLENLNKINRERNMKRASYMSFLEYVDGIGVNPNYDEKFNKDTKEYILGIVSDWFPNADIFEQIDDIEFIIDRKKESKDKFNGGMVIKKYGLEGKELGIAMRKFRNYIEEFELEPDIDDYDEWIISRDRIEIYDLFEGINEIDYENN